MYARSFANKIMVNKSVVYIQKQNVIVSNYIYILFLGLVNYSDELSVSKYVNLRPSSVSLYLGCSKMKCIVLGIIVSVSLEHINGPKNGPEMIYFRSNY